MKISYMKYLIYEIFMCNWNNFIYEIFDIWNIWYMKSLCGIETISYMKFVSIPYNDFIYEIFIYEMLYEIFVRVYTQRTRHMDNVATY